MSAGWGNGFGCAGAGLAGWGAARFQPPDAVHRVRGARGGSGTRVGPSVGPFSHTAKRKLDVPRRGRIA